MPRIIVIGAGFAGLSAAAYLAAEGNEVLVLEKNAGPGGRARQQVVSEGYVFDMGPSWYWMPEVFEQFFQDFGSKRSTHYGLSLLDPGFEIVFGPGEKLSIPDDPDDLGRLFEAIEPGSGAVLDRFLQDARYKYETAMRGLIYSPGLSIKEYLKPDVIKGLFSLQLLTSLRRHVRRQFRDPRLTALLEFPVLFLGATADRIPALYSLMNYAGLRLGTWYPRGGFGSVIRSMTAIGSALGVSYTYNSPAEQIIAKKGCVTGVRTNGRVIECDAVVAAADYHHVDSKLLDPRYANYPASYWESRTMAPSALLFYVGVKKRLPALQHHTLFFDADGEQHAREIYTTPQWPTQPQFYVGCPSRTDPTVAPPGHENLFLLLPLASGLTDSPYTREKYFRQMMDRLEAYLGSSVRPYIDYCQSYCTQDFERDYHAYRGNAYGLANTLRQTGLLKPSMKNKKLRNLWYAGQLTVPGPGVPPAIISGKIAAGQVLNYLKDR